MLDIEADKLTLVDQLAGDSSQYVDIYQDGEIEKAQPLPTGRAPSELPPDIPPEAHPEDPEPITVVIYLRHAICFPWGLAFQPSRRDSTKQKTHNRH